MGYVILQFSVEYVISDLFRSNSKQITSNVFYWLVLFFYLMRKQHITWFVMNFSFICFLFQLCVIHHSTFQQPQKIFLLTCITINFLMVAFQLWTSVGNLRLMVSLQVFVWLSKYDVKFNYEIMLKFYNRVIHYHSYWCILIYVFKHHCKALYNLSWVTKGILYLLIKHQSSKRWRHPDS